MIVVFFESFGIVTEYMAMSFIPKGTKTLFAGE